MTAQSKIMQARAAVQQSDPALGLEVARFRIVSATDRSVTPATVHIDHDGAELIYNNDWVMATSSEDITAALVAAIEANPSRPEIKEAIQNAINPVVQETFPVQGVFDGTYKKIGYDETNAWSQVLLGMLMQELVSRCAELQRETFWKDRPDYTSWLVDADNFLEFLLDNYKPETVIMATKYLLSEKRLPFNPERMVAFNRLSHSMAKFLLA